MLAARPVTGLARDAELGHVRVHRAGGEVDARERMREAEVPFTFRALGRKAWSDLVADHPSTNEGEAWDADTLPPALVAACAIDPVMTPEDVDALFEQLNEGQREDLIAAAWQVNGEATTVPFALHASAILASHTEQK